MSAPMEDDGDVMTQIPKGALDEALEQLEQAMAAGELAHDHDEVRPSTVSLANKSQEAYETLVEAHPGYELTEGEA